MTEEFFDDYGITLLRRDSRVWVRYDAGGVVGQMREDEVSEGQAIRLQLGEQSAYEVLLELGQSR
jgi:hypothetical protein